MIEDRYGRRMNYLRLAVTDRCNLRCTYCMPSQGLDWIPRNELMSYEEMLRLCSLFVKMGVEKIRITGGEPFVRRDLLSFLTEISRIQGLQQLTLTTNGLLTADLVPHLKSIGIRTVNLSLDTLDKDRFIRISRRDGLDKVLGTLDALITNGIAVNINTVVMENLNIPDIIPMVRLTEKLPVTVRFIEEMPFNGGDREVSLQWDYRRILDYIQDYFPLMVKDSDPPHATALNFKIAGHCGRIGVIAAYTRSFCGSCNRIRITPTGVLRTCLYDPGKLNLKDAIRAGSSDEEIKKMIMETILTKKRDGWQAAKLLDTYNQEHESMATIGG